MTTISKCLAVVIALCSLAFLGFAVATFSAGPNWRGEIDDLDGYTFEQSSGPAASWTVKTRMTEENISVTHPSLLPSAVLAAREDLDRKQRERLEQLDRELTAANEKLEQAKRFIETDVKAMDKRLEQLDAELADLHRQIREKGNEGIELAEKIREVQADTELRRAETVRLQGQIEELRTDKFRILTHKKRLTDLLVRLNGDIERLKRRNRQLKSRQSPAYEEEVEEASEAVGAN